MLSTNLTMLDKMHIWHPAQQMKDGEVFPPIIIDHAKDCYLYDNEGKEYIDIISSWWCNLLGHCHPEINAAIKKQLDTLEHVIFSNFSHEPAIRLCQALLPLLPEGLTRFQFCDNGSSAVECALKMAFQYQLQIGQTHRTKYMCLNSAYHGETIGALSVGAMDLYARLYKPLLMENIRIDGLDCYRCPYHKTRTTCQCECFEYAEQAFALHGQDTVALIVEPLLQGAAGMRMYPPAYLTKLKELCAAYGVLLIDDEIAAGFGRTGTMFAIEQAHVSPDILCTSKGLTGGYLPMALTITSEEIYQSFYADYNKHKAFMHSHTYAGNPLACTTAVEVLKILNRDQVIKKSREKALYLHTCLKNRLKDHPNIGEIRHINMINAIELVQDKKTKKAFNSTRRIGWHIFRNAMKDGLVLRPIGDVLYFNPPLIISKETLRIAVEKCATAIESILPY